ncbi:fimbria/pilus outer membrane usher protein [Yersinia enterocolitica]|nr:fimbrial biogenesis outer membrane usher protein [Yersinia enterocolitica]ELI7924974.1 fimbrial biogenesis outer membrane usher protein [Yersinia enterocolitica]
MNKVIKSHPQSGSVKFSTLVACSITLSLISPVSARDYFNPDALEKIDTTLQGIDLSQFSLAGGQASGSYLVDIYANNNHITTSRLDFVIHDGELMPVLTPKLLAELGVKIEDIPSIKKMQSGELISPPLATYIPQARTTFDFSLQRLDIYIPQAMMHNTARGYISPALWDQGLSAALLNYTFNGNNTWRDNGAGNTSNYYLNLRSGANLGNWRLRNYSTYSYNTKGYSQWNTINTYLQRDIQMLRGQMTLGDSYSPGDVFGSVQFRGAQLVSDDNMLPDSLRGFAPVIRGIAPSDSVVTIRQNGFVIYQANVAAGPFVITDLYPTAASGSLDVTVTGANGAETRFTQPFSAVQIMQREGHLKYGLTAGEYRTVSTGAQTPHFGQATAIYGLPHDITAYGGTLMAENYRAAALGAGYSLGDWGSMSIDVTYASADLSDNTSHAGQSYRLQYAKALDTTGTTLTLASYRYSTRGFYDFKDANEITTTNDQQWQLNASKRSRSQINLAQQLDKFGSLYLSAYQQDYWGRTEYERGVSAGYNLSQNGINYGLNYMYSQYPGSVISNQQVSFNVQIPFSRWLPNSWASYSMNSAKHGVTSQRVGLGGTALEDNNLSYNVQQSYGNKNTGASGAIGTNYKGSYGEVSTGYNYGNDHRQLNFGVQGGIVAHPYGVTFSQSQGDTLALVRAPGASGVKVQNNTGVTTDWRGYAVIPYVSSYRKNRIALDTKTFGDQVDIDTNTQTVIPTQGAIVLADFPTRVGSRVLLTLTYQGKYVPFGATATLIQGKEDLVNQGIVGANGLVYLSGMPDTGEVLVTWGQGRKSQCKVGYRLTSVNKKDSVVNIDGICQ